MPEFINQFFIDVNAIPKTFPGFVQLSFLGAVYGYALFYASNMIKDGSELLLLVPALAGVVGSIVLPILGAVPDGAIVVFSGLGNNAQEEVSVGVGALAGSTIMLLTVPWMLSIMAGRVGMVNGEPQYTKPKGWSSSIKWSKLTPDTPFLETGVRCGPTIRRSAVLMLITLIPYLIIQIPSAIGGCVWEANFANCKTPQWSPVVGGIFAALMFVYYLYFQVQQADDDPVREDMIDEIRKEALRRHLLSVRGLIATGIKEHVGVDNQDVPLDAGNEKFRRCIRPFFNEFDVDHSGFIERNEFAAVLARLGEKPSAQQLDDLMTMVDQNKDGKICFSEFCEAVVLMSDEGYVERAVRESKLLNAKLDALKKDSGERLPLVEAGGKPLSSSSPTDGKKQKKRAKIAEGLPSSSREGYGGIGEEGKTEEMKVVADSSSAASASYRADDDVDGDDDDDAEALSDDDDGEEEVSVPEDLAHLSPSEQQYRIIKRSFILMGLGVAIVLIFSDPMVEVMTVMGEHTGIKPFYISFVLAPLASNASEVVASYAYALKKTEKTITISFSSLIGAACMNNTFCLSLFLRLIYFQKLEWAFTAETIAIIVIEIVMFFVAIRRVHHAWTGFAVLALFPLSIALVAGLESIGFD